MPGRAAKSATGLSTPTLDASSSAGIEKAAYLSLLFLAVAVFAPTLTHQFVWDDLEQVRDNEVIRHWSSFFDFWHKDILELSRKGGQQHSNYYRPLFYVQYLFYFQLFGLNTVAWHALAILHHWFASAAALLFLRRLKFPIAVAWPAALLFVVHPAHGESVSWVAAAFNDPPAATCLLLGLSAHVNWIRGGSGRSSGLALLGYGAALCLKESALSMLLLVPLVEWYVAPTEAWRSRIGRFVPYMGLTLLYLAVRKYTLGWAAGNYGNTKSLFELAPTFPLLAVHYVRLLVWPVGLAPSYPLRYVPGWASPTAWGGILGVLGIIAVLVLLTHRRRALRFACVWVAFCIWPVFNIASFLPTYLAHQRYLYLASLGVCLGIAWILSQAIRNAVARGVILVALLGIWSGSNLYYDPAWKTDTALWTRICEVDPHNPAGFDWLGARAREAGRFDEAEKLFHQSINADPDSPYSYQNLGALFYRRQQPAVALAWYLKAIDVFARRNHDWEVNELLQCRINSGACLAGMGRTDEALKVFLQVADTPPYPPDAARNAATLLRQMNQLDRIEPVLKTAVERHPKDASLLLMIVDYYRLTNRARLAGEYARRLADLAPNSPEAQSPLQSPH